MHHARLLQGSSCSRTRVYQGGRCKDHPFVRYGVALASESSNIDDVTLSLRLQARLSHSPIVAHHAPIVTVDESIREEDGSDDEEKDEDVKSSICQLL